MQIPADTAPYRLGSLEVSGNTCSLNPVLSQLCDPNREVGNYHRDELRELGQQITTTEGSMPFGAWLLHLVEEAGQGLRYARGTVIDSTLVDAMLVDGGLRVLLNTRVQQRRQESHELRNRVNAIKVNGELAKMLAIKEGHQRAQLAAETVLSQCDQLIREQKMAGRGAMEEPYKTSDNNGALLRRLHSHPGQVTEAGALEVQISDDCPAELLCQLSHTLALFRASTGGQPGIRIGPGQGGSIALQAEGANTGAWKALFQRLQASGFEQLAPSGIATCHLPASVPAYEIVLANGRLAMCFRVNG